MKREFRNAGYVVYDQLLDAVDYGVPQHRVRNIMIGVRDEVSATYSFPAASTLPGLFGGLATVGDALFSPPVPTGAQNHDFTRSSRLNLRRLKHIPEGGSMMNCPSELQNNSDVKRAMRRLDRSKPSYTIVHNNCDHFYHPTEDRRITIREMARLQGFPDDFVFFGSKSDQSIQVANAVPVPLAEALARSISSFLETALSAAA